MSDAPSTQVPPRTYRVRRGEAASEAAHIQHLWAAAFENLQPTAAAAKLDAQYLHNPAGRGECFFLEVSHEPDPVGVQCLVRRRFRKDGVTLTGGTMADYVVDSRHRSLGPALQLMKHGITYGSEHLEFLYGFPNKKAEPIFKRAGLVPLTTVTRYAKLMRSKEFLTNRLAKTRLEPYLPMLVPLANVALMALNAWQALTKGAGWRWHSIEQCDAEFDFLWQECKLPGIVVGDRSSAMLNWRYPHRRLHHISAGRLSDGRLSGYAVWSLQGDLLVIHDFYCNNAADKLAGMLSSFAWKFRHTGAKALSLEFSGPANLRIALSMAGFRERDGNPVYMLPGRAHELGELGSEHWYLTGYDRDSD